MVRLGLATTMVTCIAIAGCAPAEKSIRWDQIDKEVKIIGPLGVPLGKWVRVRGRVWGADIVSPHVSYNRSISNDLVWVDIDEVDGIVLRNPVRIRIMIFGSYSSVMLEPNVRFDSDGYQACQYGGYPYNAPGPKVSDEDSPFAVFFLAVRYHIE